MGAARASVGHSILRARRGGFCRLGYFRANHDFDARSLSVWLFCSQLSSRDWYFNGHAVQGHNVPYIGLLTTGESLHNNHHALPGSAKLGLRASRHYPRWWVLCALRALGLAWNIKLPSLILYHGVREALNEPDAAGKLSYSAGLLVLDEKHPHLNLYRSAELTPTFFEMLFISFLAGFDVSLAKKLGHAIHQATQISLQRKENDRLFRNNAEYHQAVSDSFSANFQRLDSHASLRATSYLVRRNEENRMKFLYKKSNL